LKTLPPETVTTFVLPPEEEQYDPWDHISPEQRAYVSSPNVHKAPCPWCGGRNTHSAMCNELTAGWVVTMPWGKHKGKPLSEVPQDYLDWLTDRELTEEFKQDVRRELDRRREEP